MKTVKIVLASILTAQVAFAGSPATVAKTKAQSLREFSKVEGPSSTGGGEYTSQEARAIISSLPAILRSTGLQYFPEINIDEFEAFVQSGIQVELAENITVNGAPKACRFNKDLNLIQVDAKEWEKVKKQENAEVTLRALVFHEVLGLMGLEKNNDYSISNRLVGAQFLSLVGIKGTKDQIFPKNISDKQVIYWRVSDEGRISFFYCKDRTLVSTCSGLGSRSYTSQELDALYRTQFKDLQANIKGQKHSNIMVFVMFAGVVAILAVSGGTAGTVFGALSMTGVLSGLGAMLYYMNKESEQSGRAKALGIQVPPAKRAAYLEAGTAQVENFTAFAQSINDFLNALDQTNDLTPKAPVTFDQKLN